MFSAYKRLHGDDSVLNEEESGPKDAKRPRIAQAFNSKYLSDPLFNEFLKVRGADASATEKEEEEDTSQILLEALEGFKG